MATAAVRLGRRARGTEGLDRIAAPPAVEVEAVERHTGNGDAPAHATLLVGRSGEPRESRQRWLLAEGWWAAEVSPPTFKAFVRWVLPMLPWLAAEYVVVASRRSEPQSGGHGPSVPTRPRSWLEHRIESVSLTGLLWLLSPVIAVLAMLACVVLALLQRVPVIGKRVNAATANLVSGVGDAYLFAYDGLARAAMLQRISRNLKWLRADARRCRNVVIVAHSQGAALCHDLLRSGALRPGDPVDLLVTVGSGVRRLDGFRELYYDAKLRSLGWLNIAGLLALVTGMALVLSGFGASGDAGLWAGVGGLAIVTGSLIVDPTVSTRKQLPGKALVALGVAVMFGVGLLSDGWAQALLVAGAVSMSVGVWLYWVAAARVHQRVMAVSKLALPRAAVRRWLDFDSSADPVPNGPLRTRGEEEQLEQSTAVHPESRCVYNLQSIQADHSYYFDNTDEFVSTLAVAAIAFRLGGGPGWAGLGADAGVAAQPPYSTFGRLTHWLLEWLSRLPLVGGPAHRVAVQSLAGMLLAAAVVVAAALLVGRLWSVWDTYDIDRFFLQDEALGAWRTPWPPWAFLGLTALLVVGSMAAVARYAGHSWLVLVVLAGSLVLTATRLWVEWRTCLGDLTDQERAIGCSVAVGGDVSAATPPARR